MWKIRPQILYYLGLLCLVVWYQDTEAYLNFPRYLWICNTDSDSTRYKIVSSDFHFSKNCEDSWELASTNHYARNIRMVQSSMNGFLTQAIWRKLAMSVGVLSVFGILLMRALREWIRLSSKKNRLTSLVYSSVVPIITSLQATFTMPLGTLVIVSTLFVPVNSSVAPTNTTMMPTSLNETTFNTLRTTVSFDQSFTPMLYFSSIKSTAAESAAWSSSSLRPSQSFSSTHEQAASGNVPGLTASTQSFTFVKSSSFGSLLQSSTSVDFITNSTSPSPLSSRSLTSPSSSHVNSLSFLSSSKTLLSFPFPLLSPAISSEKSLLTFIGASLTLSSSPLSLSQLAAPLSSVLSLVPSSSPLPLAASSSLLTSASSVLPPLKSSLPASASLRSSPLPSLSSPSSSSSPKSASLPPLPISLSSSLPTCSSASLTQISPISSPSPPPLPRSSSLLLSVPSSPLPTSTSTVLQSPNPSASPSLPSLSSFTYPSSLLSQSPSRYSSPSPSTLFSSLLPSLSISPLPSLSPLSTPLSSSSPLPSLSAASVSPLQSPSLLSPPLPLSTSLSPPPSSPPSLSSSSSLLTYQPSLPSPSFSSPSPFTSPPSTSTVLPLNSSLLISPSLAISITVQSLMLVSSTFIRNNSLQDQTSTMSGFYSSITANLTSTANISAATSRGMSSGSSSVTHIPTLLSNKTRIINVTISLINEVFHVDMLNESSAKFANLSRRVNSTLWEMFSGSVMGLRTIKIIQFSEGSVKVKFQLLVDSQSNATTQAINQTLFSNNKTNNQGFIFGNILVEEKCSPGFCFNSGSCQDGAQGPVCSCSDRFVGSRCAQKAVAVDGKYTEWSDFSACSKTCEGGQKRRSRTCTNPPPQHGGKDCEDLGRNVEYIDCNGDVRCPVSPEVWIAVGVACGVFLLILILVVLLLLRRRRKQAEQRNGTSNTKDLQTNGLSTIIPLEVIYEDKTVPKSSPQGQTNPEFIGDDEDDDNDIYKAQLLLFLKQAHLIRPHIYPDEQDNKSDTSEYSTSRKPSAVSRVSDKLQEDKDESILDDESSHMSNTAGKTPAAAAAAHDENKLPTTDL